MTCEFSNEENILINLINEVERMNYKSHDPYDLLGSGPIVWLRSKNSKTLNAITAKEPSRKEKIIRSLVSPVYQNTHIWKLYRFMFRIQPVQHPKTMGLMLQSYINIYNYSHEEEYLKKAKICANWLMTNCDQHSFGYYCWGLPYVWPSDDHIPCFGPQSTLSAVNGLGFIDLYEITKNKKYLNVAQSVCEFYIKHLRIDKINRNKWAFSYTPYDKTHIINVNFHCAALLVKVWQHTKKATFLDLALKICNFSIAEQRTDGAWHYSAAIDGFVNAVDNTHTGDNLEYLTIIKKVLGDKFPYDKAFKKVIKYYLDNFISPEGMPYYTDTEKYPVESHPACQMLITLGFLSDFNKESLLLAKKLSSWIITNMMNKKKTRMIYRLYESGRTDRTYSISWGDSWLIKGLSILMKQKTNLK